MIIGKLFIVSRFLLFRLGNYHVAIVDQVEAAHLFSGLISYVQGCSCLVNLVILIRIALFIFILIDQSV